MVTFAKFPLYAHQNNVFSHDGNPGLGSFSCDVSGVTDPVSGGSATCEVSPESPLSALNPSFRHTLARTHTDAADNRCRLQGGG